MRIGIDARKIRDFGIGTYIRGLLSGLAEIAGADERYVIFAPERARDVIPPGFEHVEVDAPNYSATELVALARAIRRAGVDLYHAPHYIVPFTRVPVVVTIHDLIHLHQKLRNPIAPLYARIMLRRATRKAARVLAVSRTVRDQIVHELGCSREKIVVTPNGVADEMRATAPNPAPSRYFLYVGNDKPHKNVQAAVDAIAELRREMPEVSLMLVGAAFERYRELPGVTAAGFVSDAELVQLYRNALCLVEPSHEEGFGLPAAEAMAAGTAVITSLADALVETTADAALHVSDSDLVKAMHRVAIDSALRLDLGRRGIARAAALTWRACAAETRRAYLDALRDSRFEDRES